MTRPHEDPFDDHSDRSQRISNVTRSDIFDYLRSECAHWWGRMDEVAFLGSLYDLEKLPSTDPRFATAGADIHKHRVNNDDWHD
ncbi:MAG: hypothetical protein ACRDRS_24585 [Pseudonocardiaceae bacterium]